MLKVFVLLFVATIATSAPNKISNLLKLKLVSGESANVAVSFEDPTATLNKVGSLRFSSRLAKVAFMRNQLEDLRQKSQSQVIQLLQNQKEKVAFTSFWITNSLYIEGASAQLIADLERFHSVREIREQVTARIIEEEIAPTSQSEEWNILRIEAPRAWEIPGGGPEQVTVATIDTGVRGSHQALSQNRLPTHNWFDPYDGSENATDGIGHGTHVLGVIAGNNGIGVAPSAQWISCRGCSSSSCTEAALIACGQFVICPTLPDGREEDCTKGARVVNNGWGSGAGGTFYNIVMLAWRIAGIVPVFGVGGSGPGCGTVGYPGSHKDVIAVSASNRDDDVSGFSGRGPTSDGTIKPDFVAPGVDIRSAWSTSDTAYNTLSGTSMGTPHVSGIAALIFSRRRDASVDEVIQFMATGTDKNLTRVEECGGTDQWPNNIYGHGRVNAYKTLIAAIQP